MKNHDARGLTSAIVLFSALLFGAAAPAVSQVIDTNRPGFSFTPGVVGKGNWQVETGIGFSQNDSDSETLSLPNAEVRYGTGERVEVFVSSLGWAEDDSFGSKASGLTDIAVGTKIAVSEPASATKMAVLLQLSLPTGDDRFTSDEVNPAIGFIWAHSGRFNLAGTAKLSDTPGGYQFDNGLKLPFAIDDRRSWFVEWEANIPERGGDSHWANGGFQWLMQDNIQIDLNAGVGLNSGAGDYRFGVGFSIRP
jgi:hypothetical protein